MWHRQNTLCLQLCDFFAIFAFQQASDHYMSAGKLYLFPSFLAPVNPDEVFPAANIALLSKVKYFVVEELRTARRFLKACDR